MIHELTSLVQNSGSTMRTFTCTQLKVPPPPRGAELHKLLVLHGKDEQHRWLGPSLTREGRAASVARPEMLGSTPVPLGVSRHPCTPRTLSEPQSPRSPLHVCERLGLALKSSHLPVNRLPVKAGQLAESTDESWMRSCTFTCTGRRLGQYWARRDRVPSPVRSSPIQSNPVQPNPVVQSTSLV